MEFLEVKALQIEAIRMIKFACLCDHRGCFTEHYRRSNFANHPQMGLISDVRFVQCNESCSGKRTVHGLHFQWNPYMGN